MPFIYGYKEGYPWHGYIASLRYGALANDLFFFAKSMFAFLGGKKPDRPFGPANKFYSEPHELIVIHASSTNESEAPRIDYLALFANSPFSTFIRSPMN